MPVLTPESPEELAAMLAEEAAAGRQVRAGGAFSKNAMGGPLAPADTVISTARIRGVLQYEPNDLTISAGAGTPFAEIARLLESNRQMIPLDPPCFAAATLGGVVAANTSGPRRRGYGSVRDQVIGMTFATLEGKLIQSGGMVVKNVAGLDMGKLMIGSFGTLAVMTTINFKLHPMPPHRRTFILQFPSAAEMLKTRAAILSSVLQPVALDALNPAAAARIGLPGYTLLMDTAGNQAVMSRYTHEMPEARVLEEREADALWARIREFTPDFLREFPSGAVVRIPSTLSGLGAILEGHTIPVVARAATGVCYAHYEDARAASPEGSSVVDWSPEDQKPLLKLWPNPGNDFAIMEKVKGMFDPNRLLNSGRLYGRI